MITVKLPAGAGALEYRVHSGTPTTCPRCGRAAPVILVFARQVDRGRATLHCGCLTPEERAGQRAPQTFSSDAVRIAAQRQVQTLIDNL